ncbi:Putative malate transporter yflS, partial [Monoraphidium neglectum]
GAKVPEAFVCIAVGLALYYLVPRPAELDAQAWGCAAVFVATILGAGREFAAASVEVLGLMRLILEPLPVAPVALAGAVVALWTGTLSYKQQFSAFGNDTIWLIMAAFFFAKGVEVTGLGARVADASIAALGRSSLGLAYALALAELVLALCMPSTTARAAGIFVPVIASLAKSFDSLPHHPSSKKLGRFLFMSQAQVSGATSAMWYLGGAQTPVGVTLAAEQGVVVPSPFTTYLKGSCVPAAVLIALIPLAVYYLVPPEVTSTPWAQQEARERLKARGRPSWREVVTGLVMIAAVALWCSSAYLPIKLANASVALLGVVVLLASGAITWDDLAGHRPAWELLVWLTILFSMCTALADFGVIKWLSAAVSKPLMAKGFTTTQLFWLLILMYYVIHYGVASQTAHVTALVPPFLGIMVDAGTHTGNGSFCRIDGKMAVLGLVYATHLFGGITHYSSAQAAAYYGAGYYSTRTNILVGGLLGFASLGLFMGIGMGWWRAVGLWTN